MKVAECVRSPSERGSFVGRGLSRHAHTHTHTGTHTYTHTHTHTEETHILPLPPRCVSWRRRRVDLFWETCVRVCACVCTSICVVVMFMFSRLAVVLAARSDHREQLQNSAVERGLLSIPPPLLESASPHLSKHVKSPTQEHTHAHTHTHTHTHTHHHHHHQHQHQPTTKQ